MKLKKFILGIGILIVYALVLWQGIQAFYPQPEYNDYCDEFRGKIPIETVAGACIFPNELRTKEQACWKAGGEFRYEYDDKGCVVEGYCDECLINYNEAGDVYSRNVFLISLVAGVVIFVLGFSLLSVEPVGSALLASGVWSIFYGTVINWRNFGNLIRFVILLVVLIFLIWIALRLGKKGLKK